ncbi:MAG: hypothetical protein B7733_17495 [Myxococcales bacterium FL481]|nr:MAG: hypothetical protein B7733_17495 [Myxococcales bacterium FL481]
MSADPTSSSASSTSTTASAGSSGASRPAGAGRAAVIWGGGIALALAAMLVPVVVRVGVEGHAELERAREMARSGTFHDQVLHLGRAARWRLPIARHDELALAKLIELGEAHEAMGPDGHARALVAYREARRALLATRTVDVADPARLAHANRRIAVLMAAQERALEMRAGAEPGREDHHLAALSVMPESDPGRSRWAAVAFVAWVAASVGFVVTGVDARGRLRAKQAVRWGMGVVALLVAWILLGGPAHP